MYYNALALFTAKESMDYMTDIGYLLHLILPQNGLNTGTSYKNWMVGILLGVISPNVHLNHDLHEPVNIYVNLTANLVDNYLHKFSKQAPIYMIST